MCGIAGIWRPDGADGGDAERVRAMLATLRHRGPDGVRLETHGNAVLGHTRLAIIDLVTGDQPQADASGRVQVVVNGEIYNYREVREELVAAGGRFRTQSDIEVVPHLYRRDGDAFVEQLVGMFAMALHDEEANRLVLVRDRLGKKPLYHARIAGGVAFASEARALLALDGIDARPDVQALELFLTYQYVPAPWSAFQGIRKLPAASLMVFEAGREPRLERYWDALPEPDPGLDTDTVQERLDAVLSDAARLRLRSDVPLAVFLSGGIDSGLVASYLSAAAEEPLRAVTVGFPGADEDERGLARLTARACGARLREEPVELDVERMVEQVLDHQDEPHGDSSCVPTWIVSRAAAADVKVVVSGDGGDESFAGYADRYGQSLALDRIRRVLPAFVRRPVFGGLAALWPKGDRLPRALRLKWVARSLSVGPEEACFLDMSIFRPELKRRTYRPGFREALARFDAARLLAGPFERSRGADLLSRLLYVDRHTYLAEGVLAKVDRMSMAHSLEVRSPLLDHRVVELAARVPPEQKLSSGEGKVCLRRLAAERLPGPVVRARKAGFAPPLSSWIRGPLHARVLDAVRDPQSFVARLLEPRVLERMLAAHRAGRRDWSRPLWLVHVLESWARRVGVAGPP